MFDIPVLFNFFLLVYLLTKMYLKKNSGPWKFKKKNSCIILFWPINKQTADVQKNI